MRARVDGGCVLSSRCSHRCSYRCRRRLQLIVCRRVVCSWSGAHRASRDGTVGVKVDLDELAEAGGVVVTHGLGIAQRLEQRVGLQQLVLQVPRRRRRPPMAARQPAARLHQVLEHAPRRLGLACARLARDQDRLVLSLLPAGTAHQSGAGRDAASVPFNKRWGEQGGAQSGAGSGGPAACPETPSRRRRRGAAASIPAVGRGTARAAPRSRVTARAMG